MTKEAFQNKVARYLLRKDVKVTTDQLEVLVQKHFGITPPSVAAVELMPKSKYRITARKKAEDDFQIILESCCKVFQQDINDSSLGDDANWRDLRSAASYVGLIEMKIRPASSLARMMGLKTPAAVYHAATRGRRLRLENVLFNNSIQEIIRLSKPAQKTKKSK